MKTVASKYWHVDNGGISVDVAQNEEGNVELEISADYFGYPAVSSKLSLYCQPDPKIFLKELGLLLIEAASNLQNPKE